MAELPIQQAFYLAVQHHQAGRLGQAEQIYRQILTLQPGHVDALHMLGVIAHQVGRYDVAVDLIRQAVTLNPNYGEAFSNLGNALWAMGRMDEAIATCRQAILLKPNFPEAYSNLGNALSDKGQLDEAITVCRQSIALKPNYAEAHSNLGNALRAKGRLDEAIAAYRQAIAIKPNYAEAVGNLGAVLSQHGRLDEAITACRKAIALRPNFPEAYSNLGNVLRDNGQLDEAITACGQAIALEPNFPEAHNNLGLALRFKGQFEEAITSYQRAIALNPAFAAAHSNLGCALKDNGRLDEAIAAHRHAIGLKPDYVVAHSNVVFSMLYHPDYDARAIAQETFHWSQQHAEPLRKFIQPHANDRNPERRLRIGYVSADFRTHACAYFLVPLLEHHDPQQVELFCYAQVSRSDAITDRLRQAFSQYRSTVGFSDEQMERQIRDDRIDILVDLKLHTDDNRLLVFARKPAPVQVTWLGYPGSTGIDAIDYRLSDPYMDPSGMDESVYSEKTIRLPDCFWCYDPLDSREIAPNALPALANGMVTFGCLNNFCKVNDVVLRLWAQILLALPSSRMLLQAPEGSARQRTLELFEREGIVTDRIEFVARQPRRQYMQLYRLIDLSLDSFPYNGHTTSLDSLWMGVPVITVVGRTAVGRAGASQLMNLNLPELIAQTPEKYVEIAVALANNLPRLNRLRSTLRQRMEQSPLMDAPRFARNVETEYRRMWRHWCQKSLGPSQTALEQ